MVGKLEKKKGVLWYLEKKFKKILIRLMLRFINEKLEVLCYMER